MPADAIVIRRSTKTDCDAVLRLYLAVAETPGGLARTVEEISREHVKHFLELSASRGLSLCAWSGAQLLGEIHAYTPMPAVFRHVLSELTIAVHPSIQGRGIGRRLFTEFLRVVEAEFGWIERVELIARESNAKTLAFYESVGFRREGRMQRRIASVGRGREADIPMAWLRAIQ